MNDNNYYLYWITTVLKPFVLWKLELIFEQVSNNFYYLHKL